MKKEIERDSKNYVAIDWRPDKASKTPIYKQIVEYISEKISSGDWTVGSKLIPQRNLANLLGVNRSTVVLAMEILTSYGMLESSSGSGTRIASNTWSRLMSSPPDWNKYITASPFLPNVPTIQLINKLEFDEKYIRLGTGEISMDLYPKKAMGDVFKALSEKVPSLNYLGPLGLPELQESIAERLKRKNIFVKPSNVLITSGSLQALSLIALCMLKKGATVFTEEPSYLKSLQTFQSAGMNLTGVPMDKEGIMHWQIERIPNESLLYTIPTFQNPTGTVMSERRRKEVFEFCSSNRLPIIEDDAYGELWFSEKIPPNPMKSMDERGMILYTGTISKTLAPGLRIGWLVGPESVVERLGDVKMQMDYGASSLSQWAAHELFRSGIYDEHLKQINAKLKDRRDFAVNLLEKHFKDIGSFEIPEGGFYIWLKVETEKSSTKLFQKCLEKNILINPGSIYDYKENKYIRLSYSYAEEKDLEKGISLLSEVIKGK